MTPPLGAWGLTGTPVPLPGGHRNTVLRVGNHVLKTTRRSEGAIAWLLPVAKHAIESGLNVPVPMRSHDGRCVVDGWTCEPFCPGRPTSPVHIADRMTRFHVSSFNLPQRDGFASAHDLLTCTKGGDVDLDAMPEDLVTRLRAAWASVGRDSTIVHGDLNAANILTAADGTVTLVDWDEARRDAPVFDTATWSDAPSPVATLAWEVACSWQIESSHARRVAQLFTD